MVGQGSPIVWKVQPHGCAKLHVRLGLSRLFTTLLLLLAGVSFAGAAEKTARLRLAWGSGTAAKERWIGSISVAGGEFSELQPLGIETDAPVALRIEGERIVVNPLLKRGFDGCDVTVRAEEAALVRVELRTDESAETTIIESSLSQLLVSQVQEPLDALGSYFLARRSPGDALRVLPTRDHLVFSPGEKWDLRLQPDVEGELSAGPVILEVLLRASGEEKPQWQSSQQITHASQLADAVRFEITSPPSEGAYRLTVTAKRTENLATRFVPGQRSKPIAQRDVEFVVIDPAAKLPPLVDQWLPVLTIDPANPRWWQRLPAWAQVPRLRERTQGAIGNVRPVVRPMPAGDLLELPPAPKEGEPYWQSYTLPVREPGEPHLVEIEYPFGVEQALDLVLVEPDAAGKVTSADQCGSFRSEGRSSAAEGETAVHRFVIWPKTSSPQLLIVNRHKNAPGQYGKIRLFRQDSALASLLDTADDQTNERLVVQYLSTPRFAENLGAVESLDEESGLSVQSWSTFLDGAQRLAQSLRYAGYNGVMLSVSADGSGLYPSRLLQQSPRFDTGLLAASGQDPTKKDVLEMLLRVFDREGIQVFPSVQLAAPLPNLEKLRQGDTTKHNGISCVDYDGLNLWQSNLTAEGRAPYYNPLNDRVQAELIQVVQELTSRYSHHQSFAGVSLQLSGEGYGLMPGLASGLDDHTVFEFSRTLGISLPPNSSQLPRPRSLLLLSDHREQWKQWRQAKLSNLYHQVAEKVRSHRSDLRVVLATEDLFSGRTLRQRVRTSIDQPQQLREILPDHAVDLAGIARHPNIEILVPHLLANSQAAQQQSAILRANASAVQQGLLESSRENGQLFFAGSERFRLASFDQQSPFGPEQTYLTVTSRQRLIGRTKETALMQTLGSGDSNLIVQGGQSMQLLESDARSTVQTIKELPSIAAEREQTAQPVTLRVYRTQYATVLAVINESPWAVTAEVELSPSGPAEWQKLGASQAEDALQQHGSLDGSLQNWNVPLLPNQIQAWRFSDTRIRVGELRVNVDQLARSELQSRIQQIESARRQSRRAAFLFATTESRFRLAGCSTNHRRLATATGHARFDRTGTLEPAIRRILVAAAERRRNRCCRPEPSFPRA